MPYTFPSHIAAVIPLLKRRYRLHPTALVVGAMIPDLAYLFGLSGSWTHAPAGAAVCVPMGVVFTLWLQRLVLPVLRRLMAAMAGVDWPALLEAESRQRLSIRLKPLTWCALSCLLGFGTHLLWDGLSHHGWWPARLIYPDITLSLLGVTGRPELFVWWGSTFLGAVVVLICLRRGYPGPALPRGAWPRWVGLSALLAVIATLAGLVWEAASGASGALWWISVSMTRIGVAFVSLFCVVHRLCATRGRAAIDRSG
jgi:hypothetical protein